MKISYIIFGLFCLMLTGCGQTGPLYLPPTHPPAPPKTVTKTTTSQPMQPPLHHTNIN